MRLSALVLTALLGCSSGRTEADCERIAANIRKAAAQQGFPTQGICNNPNATAFKAACDDLHACNDEAD
jgi:hypothetical protein